MSGMASAASTTPGSVATFASCSSEWSRSMASRSSASAKTRAGTRIPGRELAGISNSWSSSRRAASSDIEHHVGNVPVTAACELELVVGHGLDQGRRVSDHAGDTRLERVVGEVDPLDGNRHETLGFGEVDELLEPGREQSRAIGCGRAELALGARL